MARFKPEDVEELFRRLAAANPHPTTELNWSNPYTLLVAVVLSAQSTDVGVNRATQSIFQEADTPEKMLTIGEDRLREALKNVNLYRNKAKNVIALSRLLIERHGGEVPRSREALEAFPGVGRKTASVVLNTAFGEPVIAVDTHIFRVGNRTELATGKTPLEVESKLDRIVPERYKPNAHHWLLLHGRYICKARRPDCPICPIIDLCRYRDKTPTMVAVKTRLR